MLFGQIGFSELIVIAFVGLVVLGPERLPKYAKDAGRMIRQLRTMATSATDGLRNELGPEFKDLNPRDLNPREMLRRLVDDEPVLPSTAPVPVQHPPLAWATPPPESPEEPVQTTVLPVAPGYDDIT